MDDLAAWLRRQSKYLHPLYWLAWFIQRFEHFGQKR